MKKPLYLEKYPTIFKPFTVGNKGHEVTIKNRILVSPMEAPLGNDFNGNITDNGIHFYADLVKGGVAGYSVTYEIPQNTGHPRSLVLAGENTVGFADCHRLTRFTHAYNAVSIIELTHPGFCMVPGPGRVIMSADEGTWNGNHVKKMDYKDMESAIQAHVEAAVSAMRGGFDIIQINCCQGWLLSQFLSPLTNHRTDEFGGSVENRCRFPKMVIEAIREATNNMPIELRLNAIDGYDMPEGIQPEDAAQQALIFEDAGVSMIHMCSGHRVNSKGRSGNPYGKEGENLIGCIEAKKAGVKIPLGVNQKMHDPIFIEEILSEGKCDYIMMSRQVIADNDYVNKIKEDRIEDIRPCLYCMHCADSGRRSAKTSKSITFNATSTFNFECAVNPLYGQGRWKKNIPDPQRSKKIVVVGGGVAGMVAATVAARRGHEVSLFEQSDKLGGLLSFADHMDFKEEVKKYREYIIRQVEKSGAEIHLGKKATLSEIDAISPDAVIVAVGAKEIIPDIPGVNQDNVILAMDAILNMETVGKNVVIIGGGSVGCDLSIALGQKGHNVTVVEMGDELASTAQLTEKVHTLEKMEDNNVKTMLNTKCVAINGREVTVVNEDGEQFLEADSVILSVGFSSLQEERDIFQGSAFDVINIGDCKKVGKILNAVNDGFDAAMIL